MFRRIILYFLIAHFFPAAAYCQEVISGLSTNPLLKNQQENRASKSFASDTLSLPFFEDFSGNSISPDPGKWEDNNVFINNTYSNRQRTRGIATFDAINSRGQLYESSSSAGFMADQLTSQPLDLEYPATASIWFSFMYEAGGLSDAPEAADSLSLQFYSPGDSSWYSVWRAQGNEIKGFKNVIIPVMHPRWLQKGFRFRFINYASLSRNLVDPSMIGNCDIWNIDYLLLNTGRNETDTVFNDVAFRTPLRSLLKRYESMPWKQFRQIYLQEMGSSIPVQYRNNDVIVRNVTRDFKIEDLHKNIITHEFSAGATNVQPQSDVSYNANLVYTFNTDNPDSALFRVTASLKTDEFDPKSNDTITYNQVFSNYFSFDDGTSEGGYGINGLGSRNAMFACRFNSFLPDTLRAIAICFNDSYLDANKRAFDLYIWDDNNGNPGNVIYSREELIVENGTIINGFYNYHIPEGVEIEGVFYIGWKQRSETFLNAGFDVNTPHEGRQYFWLNGSWNVSQVEGSVMIRPVLGKSLITRIDDAPSHDEEADQLILWPNPAKDYIRINVREHPYSSHAFICILNLAGNELIRVPFSEIIDISKLSDGMYILVTVIDGQRTGYKKFIKTR